MKKSVKIFLAGLAFCSVVTLSTVGIVGACKRNKQQATEPTGQETEKPLEKTNYKTHLEFCIISKIAFLGFAPID